MKNVKNVIPDLYISLPKDKKKEFSECLINALNKNGFKKSFIEALLRDRQRTIGPKSAKVCCKEINQILLSLNVNLSISLSDIRPDLWDSAKEVA